MRWIEAVADASISASWRWTSGSPNLQLPGPHASILVFGATRGPLPIDALEAGPAWPALHPTCQVVLEELRRACQALQPAAPGEEGV